MFDVLERGKVGEMGWGGFEGRGCLYWRERYLVRCSVRFRWQVGDSEVDAIGEDHLGRSLRGFVSNLFLMKFTALLRGGWKMLKVGMTVVGPLGGVLVIY